jgi:hypothetical protein
VGSKRPGDEGWEEISFKRAPKYQDSISMSSQIEDDISTASSRPSFTKISSSLLEIRAALIIQRFARRMISKEQAMQKRVARSRYESLTKYFSRDEIFETLSS